MHVPLIKMQFNTHYRYSPISSYLYILNGMYNLLLLNYYWIQYVKLAVVSDFYALSIQQL